MCGAHAFAGTHKISCNSCFGSEFLNLQAVGLKVLSEDDCENIIEEQLHDVFQKGLETLYLRGYDVCVDGITLRNIK